VFHISIWVGLGQFWGAKPTKAPQGRRDWWPLDKNELHCQSGWLSFSSNELLQKRKCIFICVISQWQTNFSYEVVNPQTHFSVWMI